MTRSTSTRWQRYGLAANLVALVVVFGYVLSLAYPSTEAVRLRNALLIERGVASDFDWTPARIPASFLAERLAPLPEFVAAARAAGTDSEAGDWEKAVALAAHLTRNAKGLGEIQSDLVTAYHGIVDRGDGYCADFTEVYLGLARAAGLFAREWAFSFDGFGGHGHTLIEVFDRQRGKWLFLDVFNNVHAVDATSGEPLSALEFREFAAGRRPATVIRRNGPGSAGYSVEAKLVDYYRRGVAEWYLWWGNSVFSYDAHPAVRAAGRVLPALEQLVAITVGVHPRIKVLTTTENVSQLERMERLRWNLRAIAVLLMVLLIVLLAQVIVLVRHRRRRLQRGTDADGPGAHATGG